MHSLLRPKALVVDHGRRESLVVSFALEDFVEGVFADDLVEELQHFRMSNQYNGIASQIIIRGGVDGPRTNRQL